MRASPGGRLSEDENIEDGVIIVTVIRDTIGGLMRADQVVSGFVRWCVGGVATAG